MYDKHISVIQTEVCPPCAISEAFRAFMYALLLFAQTINGANAYLSIKINIIWLVSVHVSINKMWPVNPPCKN
jgi:hypothetical protein